MAKDRPAVRLSRRDLLARGALVAGTLALPPLPARAQAVSPLMDTLSRYMAGAKEHTLPAAIVEAAKHHILDTFAAMISGSELPPGRAAVRFAREQTIGGRPKATIAASDLLAGPADAALANGVLAHSDETDDSHGESQSHPGASVVPAALALGEHVDATGERFLRAVTLGYDVGTRLTMALGGVEFRNATHRSTHAYAGTFGSAAAAGCVAGFDAQHMRWLLDYASQQASGYAVWGRDTEHVEKAFVFGGMPARNGVTAALLVQAGWNGVDDVLAGEDNFFAVNSPAGDPNALVAALGERYEIANTDIKKWTVGTPIQAPLDAIENLRKQHAFGADDVASVVVRLAPSVGAVVDNRDIPDICLQHMVAVMLLDGTASFRAAHDQVRMQDPTVLRERAKVKYVPDDELAKRLPVRVSVVEIALSDGTRLTERVEAVRGTVRNPMTRDEVVAKARDLIAPVLGASPAQRLIDAALALEALPSVRRLRPLLRKT